MSVKTIIFAAAAAAVTATAGAADTYFEQGRTLQASDVLELGLITADNAAVLEIYDFSTGTQGALLGTERLSAGANTNVRVNTGLPASQDVLAVVKIGGQVAASKAFDIN